VLLDVSACESVKGGEEISVWASIAALNVLGISRSL